MRPVPGEALGIDIGALRPSELRAVYQREIEDLRAVVDVLKGALSADNPALALHTGRSWMRGLCRQERALVGALLAVSPRVIGAEDLLDLLPGHDHVADRGLKLVALIVHKVRKQLGASVIQNVRGEGYCIPAAERDRLLASE